MSRATDLKLLVGLMIATFAALSANGLACRVSAEEVLDVDSSWYYQPPSPSTYQPNPKAIIHRKAMDRAANRQARLERNYAAGDFPSRPTVNPLQGPWQYTYPLGYRYGPPVVSNDWGNTQISLLGDENRAAAPWATGSRDSRPHNYHYR